MSKDYNSMTVAELKQYAKENGITLSRYDTTKADIIDTIQKNERKNASAKKKTGSASSSKDPSSRSFHKRADVETYNSMKVADLKAYATSKKISLTGCNLKADIIEAIVQYDKKSFYSRCLKIGYTEIDDGDTLERIKEVADKMKMSYNDITEFFYESKELYTKEQEELKRQRLEKQRKEQEKERERKLEEQRRIEALEQQRLQNAENQRKAQKEAAKAKIIMICFMVIIFIIGFAMCNACDTGPSKFSQLSPEEQENARFAYYAQEAAQDYRRTHPDR